MTRPCLAALALFGLACLMLAGCSGGSDGPAAGPFSGRWAGEYTDPIAAESGAMRLTVVDGTVTGEFTNTTKGYSGTIKGVIDATGDFSGAYTVPGLPFKPSVAGNLTKGRNGHIVGTLTQEDSHPLAIDLIARELVGLADGRGSVSWKDRELHDGSHVHLVDFIPSADCTVRISMQASAHNGLKDPYLLIYSGLGPSGSILAADDDSGGGKNALLEFDFTEGRKYVIGFNGDGVDDFGGYAYQMKQLSNRPAQPAAAPRQGGPKSAR
ncbi:MAG: hypothetical protein WCP21_08785 [Armatimonadota bacterium]